MGKHLVLVGGGHAHLTTLLHIDRIIRRGHRVSLISPAPYHYYSGMGPGMLGGLYDPHQVRFHVRKMAEDRGAAYIEGKAARVDPRDRTIVLDSGETVPYDVASFNTGSDVSPAVPPRQNETLFPVKPVANLFHARQILLREIDRRPLDIVVLGGGPAGVEIAANLRRLLQGAGNRAVITLVAGSQLLKNAPVRVRNLAMQSLMKNGIRILTAVRGELTEGGAVALSDGSALPCDFTFIATGIKPSSLFSNSSLPTGSDGGLLVNSFLQSVAHPELFGGGDCISLEGSPLAKVGVYAVRQNPVLLHNLTAMLEGTPLQSFDASGAFLLILNLGDGTGILWKRSFAIDGRLAFLLKDYIDRRFMKRFQVSGEADEPDNKE